jgi:hypothetical protein
MDGALVVDCRRLPSPSNSTTRILLADNRENAHECGGRFATNEIIRFQKSPYIGRRAAQSKSLEVSTSKLRYGSTLHV